MKQSHDNISNCELCIVSLFSSGALTINFTNFMLEWNVLCSRRTIHIFEMFNILSSHWNPFKHRMLNIGMHYERIKHDPYRWSFLALFSFWKTFHENVKHWALVCKLCVYFLCCRISERKAVFRATGIYSFDVIPDLVICRC